jgi:type I restriction enzyme S subunit
MMATNRQQNTVLDPESAQVLARIGGGAGMKEEWENIKLTSLSEISYGYTESAISEPIGPRFLRITDIQDNRVNWDAVPFCKIDNAVLPRFRLATGDIVFARTGATTGKSFLVEDPPEAVFASYLIRLRLLGDYLLPQFVLMYFQTADYWRFIAEGSSGSTQGGFNATKLGSLMIPVPPLPEQQRIVALLDEAFAGIATAKANAELNLRNARAIFESHLESVFSERGDGWIVSNIGAENRFIDYRGKTPTKTATGIPLITAKNIKMGFLWDEPKEFITESDYASWMTRGIPEKGDVLFTTEAPLANVAQLDTSEKVAFAQRVIIMQPDRSRLSGHFLKYLLLSKPVQDQIRLHATGATVQGIKASLLRSIEISFPQSQEQQESYVRRFDALTEETQHLTHLYERKLAALDELKKSLLQQAFNGEI